MNMEQQNMLLQLQQKESMAQGPDGQHQANSLKGNHRKAKSQLNQSGPNGNSSYQNQKVQQIKM